MKRRSVPAVDPAYEAEQLRGRREYMQKVARGEARPFITYRLTCESESQCRRAREHLQAGSLDAVNVTRRGLVLTFETREVVGTMRKVHGGRLAVVGPSTAEGPAR